MTTKPADLAMLEAADAIERLERELAEARSTYDAQLVYRDAMRAEIATLEKDAGRYRFIRKYREQGAGTGDVRPMGVKVALYHNGSCVLVDWMDYEQLDAAIDAAQEKP